MKVEITVTSHVKTTIDVEFPYYFKSVFDGEYSESVTYGKKVSPDLEVTIDERSGFGGKFTYELERDTMSSSYFGKEHESNREEFEAAKARALEFLNEF